VAGGGGPRNWLTNIQESAGSNLSGGQVARPTTGAG